MSYRNLETYLSPEELAELNIKNDKKERVRRVILNNLKTKTLYDPFTFMEDLAESQTDSKFSRKTVQQKAEISADEQFDMNTDINFGLIQEKMNQMVNVINKCCKDANLNNISLNLESNDRFIPEKCSLDTKPVDGNIVEGYTTTPTYIYAAP